jgi:hypothetical protein
MSPLDRARADLLLANMHAEFVMQTRNDLAREFALGRPGPDGEPPVTADEVVSAIASVEQAFERCAECRRAVIAATPWRQAASHYPRPDEPPVRCGQGVAA